MNDGAKIVKTRGFSAENCGILKKSRLVLAKSRGLSAKTNSACLSLKSHKQAEFVLLCIDIGLDARESCSARHHIDVLCSGGIEQGFAGAEECGVPFVVGELGFAFEGDKDGKRIEIPVIYAVGSVDFVERRGEFRVLFERNTRVGRGIVMCVVVGFLLKSQGTTCLLGVKLTKIALRVATIEIVHTISHVAGLLDLDNEIVGADAMNLSRGNEEGIAGARFVASQDAGQGAFARDFIVGFQIDVTIKSAVERGLGACFYHIPAFAFAVRFTFHRLCHGIIRVYLYGKIGGRAEKFDQQGELVAKALKVLPTDECRSELINEPVQRHAVKVSTNYLTFVVRKGGNFPTFAHSVVVVELFEFNDVATAPKRRFKNVSKPKRRQIDVR